MNLRCLPIVVVLALAAPHLALAANVYKCTNAQGEVAFQDHACAGADKESTVRIERAPGDPEPAAASGSTANSAVPFAPPVPQASNMPGHRDLPPMWICTRSEDGKTYISADGVTVPRMVPLGVLGVPGKSLASAYAPGGIGVSAPGGRKPPVSTSPTDAIAGDYTAVQDQCIRASREETCTAISAELDQVKEKLRRAFKDERAVLEPRRYQLEDQLDDC